MRETPPPEFSSRHWKAVVKRLLWRMSPTLTRHIIRWNLNRFQKTHNLLPDFFLKPLGANSLVIDLGANYGGVSETLAKTGAEVLAFEPDQNALPQLRFVAKLYPKIKVYGMAAGTRNRDTLLYLHKDTGTTGYNLSESSSLNADHNFVSPKHTQTIKEIDFAEFLLKLNKRVHLLKIDIEGYEIELVNHLLDKSALAKVDRVFVETHENYVPHLAGKTAAMKKRVAQLKLADKFFFDKE